jgi:hypothetical protein
MNFAFDAAPGKSLLAFVALLTFTDLRATAADNDISCRLLNGEVVCSSAAGATADGKQKPQSCNVRKVQLELNKQGINVGNADGIWGKRTAAGVERFQKNAGLHVTGLLDEPTCSALKVGKTCDDIMAEWTTYDMDRISAFWGRTREEAARIGIKSPAVIPPNGCHLRLDVQGAKVRPYCNGKPLSQDSCRNPFGVDPLS